VPGPPRESPSEAVDIKDEEDWAKEGAPRDTASDSKRAPRKKTPVLLPDRKDRVQRTKQSGRPRDSSLQKRAECQTESRALEISMVAKTVRSGGSFFWKLSQID